MPVEIYLNVAASGLLTGLVYGLMALGLSVIFGVVRVVNFAHGEMMTLAMYLTLVLFSVITSYSIHYTKLYDTSAWRSLSTSASRPARLARPERRHAARRVRAAHVV